MVVCSLMGICEFIRLGTQKGLYGNPIPSSRKPYYTPAIPVY
jgi:hypothetical protein